MGQCHVSRDSRTQADPIFLLRAEGGRSRGHRRHEQGEQRVPGSQGCSSSPLVPQFPLEALAGVLAMGGEELRASGEEHLTGR